MKFKFFAFLMLFLCTPMIAFGCVTSTAYLPDDYTWSYDDDSGLLHQTSSYNNCMTGGEVIYECREYEDGNDRWFFKSSTVTISNDCKMSSSTSWDEFDELKEFRKKSSCGDGEYYDDAKGICQDCPNTYYCVSGKLVGLCPEGFYCENGIKKSCPSGKYCPAGSSAPSDYEAGVYINDYGRPTDCPIGYYCTGGKREECEPGTYQDQKKQGSCKPCPKGSTGNSADGYGSTNCNVCYLGTYANADQTDCEYCPMGTYGVKETEGDITYATCKTCSAGKYTNEEGQTECLDCVAGYFCPGDGSVSNDFKDLLIRDKVVNNRDSVKPGGMYACPVGYVSSVSGQDKCDKCPVLKTNSAPGSTDCTVAALDGLKFKGRNISGEWSWPLGISVGTSLYNIKKQ